MEERDKVKESTRAPATVEDSRDKQDQIDRDRFLVGEDSGLPIQPVFHPEGKPSKDLVFVVRESFPIRLIYARDRKGDEHLLGGELLEHQHTPDSSGLSRRKSFQRQLSASPHQFYLNKHSVRCDNGKPFEAKS